ncbi:c-type cytochrome domain-containing protein [Prosthecobacter dejongeii]|uniref:WD40 repeat protein n=1 Tax=Prosthecobacter dejongeii TaxID=48465 RepID=A0A7W7YN48_9BACT|nr:c-type cytochrome domain-containing protein [Prosthecobacter dejongeii]MBB5039238.1 WD40 repeat protein [Prosthecobacter dejongeii]
MKHLLLRLTLFLAHALSSEGATINFEKQLWPVLKDNCLACHNKTTTKGELNMETPELMIEGGENGKGIERGQGDKSLIYLAAAGEWDSEMPPKSNKVGAVKLTSGELALLKQWIDEGALYLAKQHRVIAWEPLPESFRPIYATAITANAQYAAAARGNQVTLYHLPTAKPVTRLTDDLLIKSGLYKKPGVAHRDVIPSMAFSPDGTRLATGSFREVKIWHREELKPRPSTALASSSNSKLTLVKSLPDTVTLMDQSTGGKLRDFKHGAAISAFALSANHQRLATSAADHQIKIWEVATGKMLVNIQGDFATELALRDKANAIARSTSEGSWQTAAIAKAEKENTDLATQLKKVKELADIARKERDDKAKALKLKQDAQTAASKTLAESEALLEKSFESKKDAAMIQKNKASIEAATAAKNQLTEAQEAFKRAETAIQDAEMEITLVTKAMAKATGAVTAAKQALELAKKDLAAATLTKNEATKAHASAIPIQSFLCFSPDALQVAGVDTAGEVRVWSAETGVPISQQRVNEIGQVQALDWPTPAGWVITGSQASLLFPDESQAIWKLERTVGSGDDKSVITDRVNALAFSADGRTLAIGSGEPSRSGDILLWGVAENKVIANYNERHLDSVLCLDFSPDGKLLASGGADKVARITDLSTGKVLKVFEGHTHHVLGLSWRYDGRMLATAGADNVVKIWDWTAGDRRKNVEGWDKEVTATDYLGGSDTLATTSGDGRVRIINSAGAEVKSLPGVKDFMNALAINRTGDWLVAGGEEGVLHVWRVTSGKEIARFTPEPH